MAWSLLNSELAVRVRALIDDPNVNVYGPEETRMLTREQTEAIIHAALWAHASRSSSTAGAYAMSNLYEALGLKNWTFDQEESDALNRFRTEKMQSGSGS